MVSIIMISYSLNNQHIDLAFSIKTKLMIFIGQGTRTHTYLHNVGVWLSRASCFKSNINYSLNDQYLLDYSRLQISNRSQSIQHYCFFFHFIAVYLVYGMFAFILFFNQWIDYSKFFLSFDRFDYVTNNENDQL